MSREESGSMEGVTRQYLQGTQVVKEKYCNIMHKIRKMQCTRLRQIRQNKVMKAQTPLGDLFLPSAPSVM